jgi:hypothetical protein
MSPDPLHLFTLPFDPKPYLLPILFLRHQKNKNINSKKKSIADSIFFIIYFAWTFSSPSLVHFNLIIENHKIKKRSISKTNKRDHVYTLFILHSKVLFWSTALSFSR